jgi:hypothetical protein
MGIKARGNQHWRKLANCVGSPLEIWDYPGQKHPRDVDVHECLQYCHSCPVARQCARDAVESLDSGVIRAGVAIPGAGRVGRAQARTALQLLSMTGNIAQARRSAIEATP